MAFAVSLLYRGIGILHLPGYDSETANPVLVLPAADCDQRTDRRYVLGTSVGRHLCCDLAGALLFSRSFGVRTPRRSFLRCVSVWMAGCAIACLFFTSKSPAAAAVCAHNGDNVYLCICELANCRSPQPCYREQRQSSSCGGVKSAC